MLNFEPTLDKGAQILFIGAVSWVLGDILGFFGFMNDWLAFLTFWVILSLISMAFASQILGPEGKAVLITGCDSGFGHKLALHLVDMGYRVFACCLLADENGKGASDLKEKGSKRLHVLQMDVMNEKAIETAKQKVEELLPKDECLWAIVNNAGIGRYYGHLEWICIATQRKTIDVNVIGMMNVTKMFLPLLRKAKGRVVNVASMYGRMGKPSICPYAASKFAVEGFSECLRQEMKPFGVNVIVLEPGNFVAGTSIRTVKDVCEQAEDMWKSMSEEVKNAYGQEKFEAEREITKTFITDGDTDVMPVITGFEEAITQKYPQARYQPIDLYCKIKILIYSHMPQWIYDLFYDTHN